MGEAQGKKIASEPLRGPGRGAQRPHRGARSASQRPAWTRGHQQFAKEITGSEALTRRCDVTRHQRALRCTQRTVPQPERNEMCQPLRTGGNGEAHLEATEAAPSETPPKSKMAPIFCGQRDLVWPLAIRRT